MSIQRQPTRLGRTWKTWDFFWLWWGLSTSFSLCLMTFSFLLEGLSRPFQVGLVIIVGSGILIIPLYVNAHPGTRYNIPFAEFAKTVFGIRGAYVPILLRALIAIGWFAIQIVIGGWALWIIADSAGVDISPTFAFAVTLIINILVMWSGWGGLRWLVWLGSLAVILFLVIVSYLVHMGSLNAPPYSFGDFLVGKPPDGNALEYSFSLIAVLSLTVSTVGYWITLAVNISDFSRNCRDQKHQLYGQALGILSSMFIVSMVGLYIYYPFHTQLGARILDEPAQLAQMAKSYSVFIRYLLGALVFVSSLTTNVVANYVAPVLAWQSLSSSWFPEIFKKRAEYRASLPVIVGVALLGFGTIFLFNLDTIGAIDYISGWLGGISMFLAPVCGIMVVDYWLIHGARLHKSELFDPKGAYYYTSGLNLPAVICSSFGIFAITVGLLLSRFGSLDKIHLPLWSIAWSLLSISIYYIWKRALERHYLDSQYEKLFMNLIQNARNGKALCNALADGVVELMSPLEVSVCAGLWEGEAPALWIKEIARRLQSPGASKIVGEGDAEEGQPLIVAKGSGASDIEAVVTLAMRFPGLQFPGPTSRWDSTENSQLRAFREEGNFDCLLLVMGSPMKKICFGVAGKGCDVSRARVDFISRAVRDAEGASVVALSLQGVSSWDECFDVMEAFEKRDGDVSEATLQAMWVKQLLPAECSIWWADPELRRIGVHMILRAYKKRRGDAQAPPVGETSGGAGFRKRSKPKLFISYSHHDEDVKDVFVKHLGVLENAGLVELWSDDEIPAGSDWLSEIESAISEAEIAFLLITSEYLKSKFVSGEEIPRLLSRKRDEGLVVFPVICKPCPWQDIGWLARLQVRPKNGTPIWGTGGLDPNSAVVSVVSEVADVIRARPRTAGDHEYV